LTRGSKKEVLLVTGGCRSGKSRYAQEWAENRASKRLFLATARVTDEEMAARIRRHQEVRGEGWITVEEPIGVAHAIREYGGSVQVILMDCVTIWLSNLLLEGLSDHKILERVGELQMSLAQTSASVAMVTNEVGWGIVPDHPLGRRFRDLAGMVNQKLAHAADRVILMAAGLPLNLKGGGRLSTLHGQLSP
jgi:adenosylcobinamide kinase/adenosylcobinamide-phosphate guanylyltransferase